MLSSHAFIINTRHNILICMECHCCVNHKDPRGHIMGHSDKISTPPKDLNESFAQMLASTHLTLQYPPAPPQYPVPQIYGLAAPMPGYLICSHCHRGFKGHDPGDDSTGPSPSFVGHPCFPGQDNPPERSFTISAVQVFGRQRKETRFPVITSSPTPPPPTAWTSYQARMRARPSPSETMSMPDNYRILHQFIQKEGWLAHVEGKKPEDLTALVTIKKNDPQLPNLVSHIRAHLDHYQSRLTSYNARRLISTRPK